MAARVVVVGGGYGGITAAQALDDDAEVTLVDPKDCFVHNVAALRAAVDPQWPEKMFFPYSGLLRRGRIVRDWVVSVDGAGVNLSSGPRIGADYVIVATGTSYPFPAKVFGTHAATSRQRYRRLHAELDKAESVLLLGAGPVGLELAGELRTKYPDKRITILDPAGDILAGGFDSSLPPETATQMRADLRPQLKAREIHLCLGAALREEPRTRAGVARPFRARTWDGRTMQADLWLRCHGRQPAAGCVTTGRSAVRLRGARVPVNADLRLLGEPATFAIGDVASTGGMDTAVVAMEQGELTARNIKALMNGERVLEEYQPSQPFFAVPLGPDGGATYVPGVGLMDAKSTNEFKGQDLLIAKYAEIFSAAS